MYGLRDAPLENIRTDVHRFVRQGARHDVNPRKVGLGDLHLRFHADRGESVADDAFDALADLRVVSLAGYVDEARIESPKCVAPQQQTHARPLLQTKDPGDDTDEFGYVCLEQLV